MNRKEFIGKSILLGAGLMILPALSSCGSSVDLDEIIGKEESILKGFEKSGDAKFAYFVLKGDSFKFKKVDSEEAIVVVQNKIITGFRTHVKGTDQVSALKEGLSKSYGNTRASYDNEFGTEYKWKKAEKEFALSFIKNIDGLVPRTYYSEYLVSGNIMFF